MAKLKPIKVKLVGHREDKSEYSKKVVATMAEEIAGEKYLFYKKYGGKNGYLKYEEEMVELSRSEKRTVLTDINEHVTKAGNRWISYAGAHYYPDADVAKPFIMSFIFYQTIGSCGAYFPIYDPDNRDKVIGVLIFTSHFFYQFADRAKKENCSMELVREFITRNDDGIMMPYEDGIVYKMNGGYGMGKIVSWNPNAFEIRTYESIEMLSESKKKEFETLDAHYEMFGNGMTDDEVAVKTAVANLKNSKLIKNKMKAAKKLGLENHIGLIAHCCMVFDMVFKRLFKIESLSETESVVIATLFTKHSVDFINKWVKSDQFNGRREWTSESNDEFMSEFVDAMLDSIKGLKKNTTVTREEIISTLEAIRNEKKDTN